jgi:hypothetical protein
MAKRFRGSPPDEEMDTFSISIPKKLTALVDGYAGAVRKSRRGMCWDLIEEAVKMRQEKEADDGVKKKRSIQL